MVVVTFLSRIRKDCGASNLKYMYTETGPSVNMGRSHSRLFVPKRKERKEEEIVMTEPYRVVAINGSPHEGFGNTSQMLAMLGENLSREGLELEEIFLSQHQIGFCTGCATC